MSKILARVGALLIAGLAAATVASCSGGDGSRAGESQFPTTAKASVTTRSLPAPDPGEYRDPTDISELPVEVQIYTSMATDLVRNGSVPRESVTVQAVQDDVAREYGITLTAAEADTVVRAILS